MNERKIRWWKCVNCGYVMERDSYEPMLAATPYGVCPSCQRAMLRAFVPYYSQGERAEPGYDPI